MSDPEPNGAFNPRRRCREIILDLAQVGAPFTVYDVIQVLIDAGQYDGVRPEIAGQALRSAAMSSIIKVTGTRRARVPVSPKDWVAGAGPIKRTVKLYQGNPKLTQGGSP